MFGLETLDMLIGLVTVYLTLGIATTAIVEAVSSTFRLRAVNLEKAIGEMLKDEAPGSAPQLADEFFANPLIETLTKPRSVFGFGRGPGRPSYIPREAVSGAIEAILVARTGVDSAKAMLAKVQSDPLVPGRAGALLKELARRADGDVERFRTEVEAQFDRTVARAGGWFRRRIQLITLLISTLLVLAANVDTVALTRSLSASPAARAELVALAAGAVKDTLPAPLQTPTPAAPVATAAMSTAAGAESPASGGDVDPLAVFEANVKRAAQSVKAVETTLGASGVELGWQAAPEGIKAWLSKIVGLLISVFAVSLGAPFWFNVLQNLMKLRSSLRPDDDANAKRNPGGGTQGGTQTAGAGAGTGGSGNAA